MVSRRHKSRQRSLVRVIQQARREAGVTQRALAKKMGRAHSYVSKVELGERRIGVLEFCEWADALGVPAPELLRKVLEYPIKGRVAKAHR